MNETLALIASRRSIRDYEERPVDAATRDAVLGAALRAPTAGNMMLYSIIEVEDRGLKERLAVTCDHQPFIAKAPWVLVFLADWQRTWDLFRLSGAVGDPPPHRPLESDLLLACSDALIAAQTAVLAAESLGLGSCYIGDIMENHEEHRELLGLPRYAFPVAMLTLGWPTERQLARPLTPRFPRRHLVFRDRWEARSPADYEEMVASVTEGGSPGTPSPAADFGRRLHDRKFQADFSVEMRRSVRRALEDWA